MMSALWSPVSVARQWYTDTSAIMQVLVRQRAVKKAVKAKNPHLDYCYEKLQKVSRSFAAVIMALGEELRDATCIFYLVLRGLDTIEDDMSVSLDRKTSELISFHEKLYQRGWSISGIGDNADERDLLEHFDLVVTAFLELDPKLQEPIVDIAKKMGAGMAEYAARTEPAVTIADYELYCHYVAGLVGHGLTHLFQVSGLEKVDMEKTLVLANSMGLFLQKVNITRDYLEDIQNEPPRIFWPKEIWSRFGDEFHSFQLAENREAAVGCLNAMILDSLKHVPDVMAYLSQLRDPLVFEFCAIPQTMAIATMAALVSNPNVFTGNVKIPKGLACRLILDSRKMDLVRKHFRHFLQEIAEKAPEATGAGAAVSEQL
eukprot:RCo014117